jgi:hypothetical protein
MAAAVTRRFLESQAKGGIEEYGSQEAKVA